MFYWTLITQNIRGGVPISLGFWTSAVQYNKPKPRDTVYGWLAGLGAGGSPEWPGLSLQPGQSCLPPAHLMASSPRARLCAHIRKDSFQWGKNLCLSNVGDGKLFPLFLSVLLAGLIITLTWDRLIGENHQIGLCVYIQGFHKTMGPEDLRTSGWYAILSKEKGGFRKGLWRRGRHSRWWKMKCLVYKCLLGHL